MLVRYLKVNLAIISRKIRQKVEKCGAKLQTALTTLFRVSPYGCVRQRAEQGIYIHPGPRQEGHATHLR